MVTMAIKYAPFSQLPPTNRLAQDMSNAVYFMFESCGLQDTLRQKNCVRHGRRHCGSCQDDVMGTETSCLFSGHCWAKI